MICQGMRGMARRAQRGMADFLIRVGLRVPMLANLAVECRAGNRSLSPLALDFDRTLRHAFRRPNCSYKSIVP